MGERVFAILFKIKNANHMHKMKRTNMNTLVAGGLPKTVEAGLVSLVISVGEVEPSHRHAGIDQFLEGGDIPTGRAQGANDLSVAGLDLGGGRDGVEGDVATAKFGSRRHGC